MLDELMDELASPFDPEAIHWKPQAIQGNRALAIAYADTRAYQDRLNKVVGPNWSDEYDVLNDGAVVLCKLTVCGVTRSDIGEAPIKDPNTATSALAQAFKRAALKFGIGRHLYDLPKTWVDFDPQRKRLTPEATRRLRSISDGWVVQTTLTNSERVGATDFWKLYNDQGKSLVPEDKARGWAETGDWSRAMGKLKAALKNAR